MSATDIGWLIFIGFMVLIVIDALWHEWRWLRKRSGR